MLVSHQTKNAKGKQVQVAPEADEGSVAAADAGSVAAADAGSVAAADAGSVAAAAAPATLYGALPSVAGFIVIGFRV